MPSSFLFPFLTPRLLDILDGSTFVMAFASGFVKWLWPKPVLNGQSLSGDGFCQFLFM